MPLSSLLISHTPVGFHRSIEGYRIAVVTVVTAADVPVNEYGLTLFDQPVFIGLDDTGRSSVPCDVSRWEADHLVVVVASP